MKFNYLTIGFVHSVILGLLWLFNIIAQLVFLSIKWINDDKSEDCRFWAKEVFGLKKDPFDLGMMTYFGFAIVVFSSILVWPLIYPAIIVFVILYGLRGFVRFKKKVNKALEDKP